MRAKLKTLCALLAGGLLSAGAWAAEPVDTSFSTPGPDKYADGTSALPGECYLLVWTKDVATPFAGVTWDGQAVDPVNSEIVGVLAQANASSACPETEIVDSHEGVGKYEVVLLDTRKPLAKESLSGFFEGAADKLVSAWTIIASDGAQEGWQKVKIAATGKSFGFNVRDNLAAGYAVVSPEEGLWTVYPLPKAIVTKCDVPASVSSLDGFAMLVEPTPSITDDPFSLEVTYQFNAFGTNIAKVVDAVAKELVASNVVDSYGLANFRRQDEVLKIADALYNAGKFEADAYMEAGLFFAATEPFWDWNCDFEISFDDDVKAGSFVLAGKYAQAGAFGEQYKGWVCSSHTNDLACGETMRLLKDNGYKKDIYVSYYEICSRVQEFLCGALNNSPENWGKTITVKLNMYENTGRCDESGYKATVGTYKYTFCGPLQVEFNHGEGEEAVEGGVVLPDAINTNYDGRAMFMLPNPAFDKASNTNVAFVGWSNQVDNTVLTYIPTNTWTANGPIKLYATWKSAKTVSVTPSEEATAIKVTDEWIEKNVGTDVSKEEVEQKLAEDVPDSNLKVWQTYVLGLETNASLAVESTAGNDETNALVVSSVVAPAPDSGFKVTYSLDKVESDQSTVKKEGSEQESKNLAIDLTPPDDTPTGYYKMNVFLTSEESGKEEEKVKIVATNTIGVLKVESTEPLVPIAVPWTSLENSTASSNVLSSVSEIVKPSTLTTGDKLSAKGKATIEDVGEVEVYYNWELNPDGTWEDVLSTYTDKEGNVHVLDSKAAADYKVDRGLAVWLERQDTSKPFYLMGKYDGEQTATTEIKAPKAGETTEYNLVAPSAITDADLNAPGVFSEGDVGENDQVMVLRNSVPLYYTYKNNKWGYSKSVYTTIHLPSGDITGAKQVRVEDDSKVTAGTGVWYISKGGEPTIKW